MEKEYEIISLSEKKEEKRKICFIYLDETHENKHEVNSLLLKELEKKEVKLLGEDRRQIKKVVFEEKKKLNHEENKLVRIAYGLNSTVGEGVCGDITSIYRLAALLRQLDFNENSSFLDLGCGSGHILLHLRMYFPRSRFYGVEINSNRLLITKEILARYNQIEVFIGDAYDKYHLFQNKVSHIYSFCEANGNLSPTILLLMIDPFVKWIIFSETNSLDKSILREVRKILGEKIFTFDIKIMSTSQPRYMAVYKLDRQKKEKLREKFSVVNNSILLNN